MSWVRVVRARYPLSLVLACAACLVVGVPSAGAVAPVAATIAWNGLLGSDQAPAYVNLSGTVQVKSASFGGDYFYLAIGTDNNLYTWGNDQSGELGNGSEPQQSFPVPDPTQVSLPGGVEPVQVAAGGEFSLVLGANGELYSAGDNTYGQLGTGSFGGTSDTFKAVTFPQGVTIKAISAGEFYALALSTTGTVYAWGDDAFGQLGDAGTANQDTPQAVTLPGHPAATATVIAAGRNDSYAIGSDGTLYSWGLAGNFIGNGSGASANPAGPTTVTMPQGVTATSVAAGFNGDDVVYAIGSDGNLYGWGDNYDGMLGDGTANQKSTPEKISLPGGVSAASVSPGTEQGDNYVIDTSGQIYSDGYDDQYALGNSASGSGTVSSPGSVQETFKAIDDQPTDFVATAVFPGGSDSNLTQAAVATGTTDDIPPVFTTDSPPSTLNTGSGVDYTFAASGLPAPTFSLAPGAPSWLSIDPSTGELTGTAPPGYGEVGYTVIAQSSSGEVTAGPFYLADPAETVTVSGQVVANGQGVQYAKINACAATGSYCNQATTDTSGDYSVNAIAGSTITIAAYPSPGLLTSGGLSGITVPAGGLTGETITLSGPGPHDFDFQGIGNYPAGSSTVPVVSIGGPAQVTISGCPDGFGTMTVLGVQETTGQWTTNIYALTETSPGSGQYTGTIPPQYPIHGGTEMDASVSCPPQNNLVPSLGPATGGTTVTIGGSGFTGTSAVDFGSKPATSFSVLADQGVQAVAPPGTGTVPVTVTTPSGTQTVDDYTSHAVTSVTPASGPAADGTDVTITGTGLGSADEVDFGGVAAAITSVSDDKLTAVAPPGTTGAVDVTVQTVYGGTTPTSAADRFTYGGQAADRAPRARSAVSRVAAPPPVRVAVGTPSRTYIGKVISQLIAAKAPDIIKSFENSQLRNKLIAQLLNGIKPCEVGEIVLTKAITTVIGPPLEAAVAAQVPEWTAGAMLATSETGPGALVVGAMVPLVAHGVAAYVLDQLAEGLAKSIIEQLHCEEGKPTIIPNVYIDPSGNVLDTNGNPISGATVSILRSDVFAGPFAPVDVTQPGIQPAVNPETTGADGSFEWEVYAGFYEIQASHSGCTDPTDSSSGTSTIGPYPVPPPQTGLTIELACPNEPPAPKPAVTALGVDTGPPSGGTSVLVSGTGFTPTSTVKFGATAASSTTYLSPVAIFAVAPAGTGTEDVVVHGAGGSSATSSADRFYYGNAPQVTGLSVTRGSTAGGTTLTISGSGFTDATEVGFGALPAESYSVVSDSQIHVTTRAGLAGTVDVTVETPVGVSTLGSADRFTFVGPGVARGPVLSKVSLASRKFTARTGTTLRLTLSQAARLTVQIDRSEAGHRKGRGACKTKLKKGKRCTVLVRVATLHIKAAAGTDRLKFVPGKLAPGSYEAVVVAVSSTGTSAPAVVKFTIKKPPKPAKKHRKHKR